MKTTAATCQRVKADAHINRRAEKTGAAAVALMTMGEVNERIAPKCAVPKSSATSRH